MVLKSTIVFGMLFAFFTILKVICLLLLLHQKEVNRHVIFASAAHVEMKPLDDDSDWSWLKGFDENEAVNTDLWNLEDNLKAIEDYGVGNEGNVRQYILKDDGVHMEKEKDLYPKLLRIRRDNREDAKGNYYYDTEEEEGNPQSYDEDSSTSCRVPSGLKTVEILCKLWPSTIACKSYCIYGSTYNEGIERTHVCHHKEDKWSKEFEECKPFVDCKLQLVTPGDINCLENRVTESPKCQVWCEVYEDKDETPTQVYECKSDGTWKPPLPFCVKLKGTSLAKAPKKTEHGTLSYPKNAGKKN